MDETIIFLDFDGVLHPLSASDQEVFCRTPQLWEVLLSCPRADIVFSTSWRELFRSDQLVRLATAGGGEEFAARFIGVTTPIVREEGAYFAGPYYRRYLECRQWLSDNGLLSCKWLAIDDDPRMFPRHSLHLYQTNAATGLTELDVERIIERLNPSGSTPGLTKI